MIKKFITPSLPKYFYINSDISGLPGIFISDYTSMRKYLTNLKKEKHINLEYVLTHIEAKLKKHKSATGQIKNDINILSYVVTYYALTQILHNKPTPIISNKEGEALMKQISGLSIKPNKNDKVCTLCNKSASKKCPVCYTRYCSSKCQHEDWDIHKKICKILYIQDEFND
jgi:hypothetical protein